MVKKTCNFNFDLHPDRNGIIWDAVLYVPTVAFLLLWGLKLWYGKDTVGIGYALMFLGFFFLMVGGGRIFRRLQLLPSSPLELQIETERVRVRLKSGESVSLVKGVRFFPDYAGKSFGLSGTDHEGMKKQFVFHRTQFANESEFRSATDALQLYKA